MKLRERISSGKPMFGYCQTYDSPGIVENVGGLWDWLWIDAQHGELNITGVAAHIRAAEVANVPSIVRVPELSTAYISMALDNNATGVMVPMVETAEQAQAAVSAARFPPNGGRSYAGRRACDIHSSPVYLDVAAERTIVVLQIETLRALQHIEEIAAVPGVDVLFIGPSDLKLSMGLSLSTPLDEPEFSIAIDSVVASAARHSVAVGTVAVSKADVQWYLERGLTFMAVGVDSVALQDDAQIRLGWVREF